MMFHSLARKLIAGIAAVLIGTSLAHGSDAPKRGSGKTNRLIHTSSPYLLQHAHNPVDWYPWSDEAFERAVKEDKPIFLSIGYAACHWCHVMAHESFENEVIAAILNKDFISIKVDREERPDIDEVYMAATVAMTGRGGWPMTVFMTPDKKPFECGTYFRPFGSPRRPGFRELCLGIAKKWKDDRESLLREAGSLVRKVQQRKRVRSGSAVVDRATISRNVERIAGRFDPVLGGRRGTRKFPPTMALELFMREFATQQEISKPHLLEPVITTLNQMADGGIYDHVGGGICRYSVDPRWFAPHFEKMLYDQGTVSGAYLSAYQLLGDEKFARTARSILDYCLADLQDADGGFYSSRDADSEGEEGVFYVWTQEELFEILDEEDAKLFCDYYSVRQGGNWHGGKNILHVKQTDEAFAESHSLSLDAWRAQLNRMRRSVFDVRSKRIPPGLDDKILTEWNGLIINSLARAGAIFNEPRYRQAAMKAADFILEKMVIDGRLYRVHRNGKTYNRGFATDYTSFIESLITLSETTGSAKYLAAAESLSAVLVKHFHDKTGGGFYYIADDGEQLLVRSKNPRDGVVPSANSTAALNFLRLAVLLHRPDLRELAIGTFRAMQRLLNSGALERMQWAALFFHVPPKEIAIIGDPDDPATQALLREVYQHYLPNKVVAVATPEQAANTDAPTLIRRKTLVRGKPGAYVCRNYVCGLPVNTPEALRAQLEAMP